MTTVLATGGRPGRGGHLLAALALAGCIGATHAATAPGDTEDALRAELARLTERLAQTEQRLKALEDVQARTEQSLASERISEDEPELVTRLKAVESQALSTQQQARHIEALEGISVEANLISMVQQIDHDAAPDGQAESRLNYRGDVSLNLPGGSFGNAEGALFAHLRFGQGNGVGLRPTYTSTPNTTTFEVAGVTNPDSSFAVLGQIWYQLDVPLPRGGFKPYSKQRLTFNLGKIDPFIFFDQNAAADDEGHRFVNNAFVHNPLLDSGGDVGFDAYGFMPGLRVAYANERNSALTWGLSAGVFGSGPAADFSGSLDQPLLVGQIEVGTRLIGGLPGNYRFYAWRNGRAEDFDGTIAEHAGWGISVDQRVGDAFTLFGRYGDRVSGSGAFDRALTLGTEVGGNYWRRAADALGIAGGLLYTGSAYRNATVDGSFAGYAASGPERLAELYYRFRLNEHVEFTPDLQWIQRPAGNDDAPDTLVIGLRARVGM